MCQFQPISQPGGVCPSRRLGEHAAEDVYEVVQSPQVAVLPVAFHPGRPVVQSLRLWQRDRLPKVDHPHSGLPGGVVHEEQGAAHDLWRTVSTFSSAGGFLQKCSRAASHLVCSEEL